MRVNGERETENAKNEAQMKVNGERETENGNVLLGHRTVFVCLSVCLCVDALQATRRPMSYTNGFRSTRA